MHDECNGDVFGSDICTCRPYLTHAIEECIQGAQKGRRGPHRLQPQREGRALGEVTKFLVYNAQRRAATAPIRITCAPNAAGVQDMRFQELMPDVLHWLASARSTAWSA